MEFLTIAIIAVIIALLGVFFTAKVKEGGISALFGKSRNNLSFASITLITAFVVASAVLVGVPAYKAWADTTGACLFEPYAHHRADFDDIRVGIYHWRYENGNPDTCDHDCAEIETMTAQCKDSSGNPVGDPITLIYAWDDTIMGHQRPLLFQKVI